MDKKEAAEAFQRNMQHNQTTDVTINDKKFEVDNGIKGIVEKLNFEYDIKTFSSCSGILEEHYNIDRIEEQAPYKELKSVYGQPPRGYMLLKRPFLSTESFMHSFSKDKVEVETDFYRELGTSLDVPPSQHMKRSIQWKVDVGGSYPVEWENVEQRKILYRFGLTLQSRRNIVMSCSSYQEYDLTIRKAIEGLEESFDAVLEA